MPKKISFFVLQAEDGIRDLTVTGVQTCALPIFDEAAGLLDAPTLGEAATAYREAAARWHEVAEVAAPAGREPFAEARRLTRQLQDQVERGNAAQAEAAATAADLWALRDRWQAEFPGGDGDAEALLPALAGAVTAACDAEEAALKTLAAVLPPRPAP